jgi:hypothetical protein
MPEAAQTPLGLEQRRRSARLATLRGRLPSGKRSAERPCRDQRQKGTATVVDSAGNLIVSRASTIRLRDSNRDSNRDSASIPPLVIAASTATVLAAVHDAVQ